ncbi:bifunctional ADP-dependent (S)-NAD(P)H-hydrate dehydratase/NAD(P)H-hydrate epimerase [Mycobacterium tuberculosis variant microti]|nr:bifunctional ADP-dependent (S)-NAD(P)H-hydrate dehydratase/NAD(P)H-hydrate epimerase [Mycobacterium tuberculosis variant bovis BCG]AMC61221.1 bifunctional ADP-dependent (S)-NAD(P)H-hydrate dehydratase/NAD(P)H-hydrate epimerase [Mycobacterium tuberculosis variant microti]AMC75041.1 bifunctional ADP-dependent (S)-NAD(P)H-hydrate dehydratase/NAD(P)H-hydrate epimerase [Mycobacterium tuberculosis]
MWPLMRDADVGASPGPGSAAAAAAARACTNAAAAAASPDGNPDASSAPIIPDSTSPDPAVAAQDWPAGLR